MSDRKSKYPRVPGLDWSRREFMQRAALTGGAAGLGGAPFLSGMAKAASRPFGMNLATPDQPVDHIIVLMMENRAFDHYFGWRTNDSHLRSYPDHPEDGNGGQRPTHHLGGPQTGSYQKPDYRGCGHTDPAHGWDSGRGQIENGFLTGRNDEFAIGYYLPQDIEFYAKLANNFTLCDNYYCSLMASTFPNREYMHSAQSGGIDDNGLPVKDYPEHATGFSWKTIWDSLEEAGIPWGYYYVDLPAIGLWGPRLVRGAHHLEHFFEDAHAGTLPNVVFVDPGFTTGLRTDEHPYSDIRAAQAFAHNIVQAVVRSPLWARSALFLNYDEWGGFFDHIQTPPQTADDRAGRDADGNVVSRGFDQLGFRVPCTIVSPYARRNALSSEILAPGQGLPATALNSQTQYDRLVTSTFYDHTSILRFIENRFGLPPLTQRDAAARDISELLALDAPANLDGAQILESLPRVPVTSPPCEDEELEGAFVDGPLKDAGYNTEPAYRGLEQIEEARNEQINHAFNTRYDDDFQRMLESGVFESLGYSVDQVKWRYLLGS